MAATTTTETTCLFCSLCCPAGVAFDANGLPAPAYPGHSPEAHHGLCFRGHYIADLVGNPGRLHEALVREGESARVVAPADALRQAAETLRSKEGLAVVVDGNLTCEEIVSAVRTAREALEVERVAIFVPPADLAILRGVAATGTRKLSEADLADCDVVLAVGDPFATHPVVASAVLDALGKARGNCLVNIDPLRGRTARYAVQHCRIAPGGEAAALAGLLVALGAGDDLGGLDVGRAAEMAGLKASDLEELAATVGRAERLAVLVSLPEGRCECGDAAAALAARVAEVRGGGVLPLLTYGNATGAWRLAAALGTEPVGQVLREAVEGKVNRLVVLGTDLVWALPTAEFGSAEVVVAGSALPSGLTTRSRFVVPMALWFESEGTVVDGSGVARRSGAVAGPPKGAMRASEIVAALAGVGPAAVSADELGRLLGEEPKADLAEVLGESASWAAPRGDGKVLVVSRGDGRGFAEGSLTSQLAWPVMVEPVATLALDPARAADLGETATVRTDGVEVRLAVVASEDVPPGVAAVAPHFPSTRMLLGWGERGVGPGRVAIEKG